MCGITVFFNYDGHNFTRDTLVRMCAAMRHRGPDAGGIYIDNHIGLGHVRLGIIDLSGGDQPIHNEDETVWIIYNGEVYNYPELRAELEKQGHRFYTTTDTEVLVHLYEEHGVEFLNKLNGQWAFAIWDTKRQRLFIARDRVGVRPIHYTTINGTFIFASEIRSIFAVPSVSRGIDSLALKQIFTFWTTLPGRTAFLGVDELKPGHYLLIDRNTFTIEKYWDIPLYKREQWERGSPEEIAEKVRTLLVDAVRIRLRADVPVATYLSGGLDSSGISAIVVRKFNPGVQTFGIRFEEERFDEGEHQNSMAKFLRVKHHETIASNTTIGNAFVNTVLHCEKPILRTAPVPLFLLARLVRETGIKVVLTGEGADEFHGGYDIFKEALIRRFWSRRPDSAWRGKLIERLYPDIFRDKRTRKSIIAFFGRDLEKLDDPLSTHMIRWNNTARIMSFFSERLKSEIGAHNVIEECIKILPDDFVSWHTLHKAQYLEISIFLSNYLLSSQGDRMGMAHSVEVRMPFLDHRLIDYMGRVPPWWKICGLHEKHVLKKALIPFLPPSVIARVKHPYRAPIHQSLLSLVKSEAGKELLSDRAIRKAGLFDPLKTSALVNKLTAIPNASETDSMALAGIISTQILFHEMVEKYPHISLNNHKDSIIIDKRVD